MRIVMSFARVSSGKYFATGSLRLSLPSCCNKSMAVAVNCFEMEPMG